MFLQPILASFSNIVGKTVHDYAVVETIDTKKSHYWILVCHDSIQFLSSKMNVAVKVLPINDVIAEPKAKGADAVEKEKTYRLLNYIYKLSKKYVQDDQYNKLPNVQRFYRADRREKLLVLVETRDTLDFSFYCQSLLSKIQKISSEMYIIDAQAVMRSSNVFYDLAEWNSVAYIIKFTKYYGVLLINQRSNIPPKFNRVEYFNLLMLIRSNRIEQGIMTEFDLFVNKLIKITNTVKEVTFFYDPHYIIIESCLDCFYYSKETMLYLSTNFQVYPTISYLIVYYLRSLVIDYYYARDPDSFSMILVEDMFKFNVANYPELLQISKHLQNETPIGRMDAILNIYLQTDDYCLIRGTSSRLELRRPYYKKVKNLFLAKQAEYFELMISNLACSENILSVPVLLELAITNDDMSFKAHIFQLLLYLLHLRPMNLSLDAVYIESSSIIAHLTSSLITKASMVNTGIAAVFLDEQNLKNLLKLEESCNPTESNRSNLDQSITINLLRTLLANYHTEKAYRIQSITKIYDITKQSDNKLSTSRVKKITELTLLAVTNSSSEITANSSLVVLTLSILRHLFKRKIAVYQTLQVINLHLLQWYSLTSIVQNYIIDAVLEAARCPSTAYVLCNYNTQVYLIDILTGLLSNLPLSDPVVAVKICEILCVSTLAFNVWELYTRRIPILDHVLAVFDAIDYSGNTDLITSMLICLSRFVTRDECLSIRIAKHNLHQITIYFYQTHSYKLATASLQLLTVLINNPINAKLMSDSQLLLTIKAVINERWSTNEVIRKIEEELVSSMSFYGYTIFLPSE